MDTLVGDVLPDVVAAAAKFVLPPRISGLQRPQAHPVYGHLKVVQERFAHSNMYDWIVENTVELQKQKDYPGCWQTSMPMMEPEIVCTDPELIQWLLDNAESHPAISQFNKVGVDLLSGAFGRTSIFMIDGPQWAFRRKYYSHLFSLRSLREVMLPEFKANSKKIVNRISNHAEQSEAFDIQDLFARATLDAIGMIAFSEDLGSLDSEKPPEFMVAFDLSQEITIRRTGDPMWRVKRFFGLDYEKDFANAMNIVNSRIYKVLEDREKAKSTTSTQKGSSLKQKRYPILDLFEQKAKKDGHKLNDRILRDIVWDFFVAGRDTTAVASSWLTYYLIRHPDVLARVREEIKDKDLSDCNVLLHEVPYFTACCLETERLRPSVPVDSKGVRKSFTLPNGIRAPKGAALGYSPFVAGRNPKLWGNDCLQFKPERFLNEDQTDVRAFPTGQFPSFNGGPRLCLGRTMALLELKCMIATLFTKFDFTLDERHDRAMDKNGDIPYKMSITMWVKDGLFVRATPRTAEEDSS